MVSKICINYTVHWAAPAEKYLLIFAHFIGCRNNFAAYRTNAARLLKDIRQGNTAFLNAFKHICCGENVRTPHGIARVALAGQSTVAGCSHATIFYHEGAFQRNQEGRKPEELIIVLSTSCSACLRKACRP